MLIFHYIQFHAVNEFVLTDGYQLYAIDDFGRDDFYLLVETLSEFYGYTFRATVLIDEHVSVIGADEFLYRLIRRNNGLDFP